MKTAQVKLENIKNKRDTATTDIVADTFLDAQNEWKSATGEAMPNPDAFRLAFADPEFLLRREVRGIRFQLELLKPEIGLQEEGVHHTIVVYGGARFISHDGAAAKLIAAQKTGDAAQIKSANMQLQTARYYEDARQFGYIVGEYGKGQTEEERFYICTGGGPGVMEAANRGAHEAGAKSVGLNILLPHEQGANQYVTPELSFKFHYFALRKMHFMMRAKAFVAFPGGFGTLDELFEMLTLVQTKKAEAVPIILVGKKYWSSLINMQVLVDEGAISENDLDMFHVVDDATSAWRVIAEFYKFP